METVNAADNNHDTQAGFGVFHVIPSGCSHQFSFRIVPGPATLPPPFLFQKKYRKEKEQNTQLNGVTAAHCGVAAEHDLLCPKIGGVRYCPGSIALTRPRAKHMFFFFFFRNWLLVSQPRRLMKEQSNCSCFGFPVPHLLDV